MITTNDDELAKKLNILRNHGASVSEEQRHLGLKPYLLPEFAELGYNFRMTDLQGAIGLVQLEKLDGFLEERKNWAQYYQKNLEGIGWLQTPIVKQGYRHSWQAYVCLVDETKAPLTRNGLMERLQVGGISSRPGTHAVHQLALYHDNFKLESEMCPIAAQCDRLTIALPLHNCMKSDDYNRIIYTIKQL